jgi:hypothetical protein
MLWYQDNGDTASSESSCAETEAELTRRWVQLPILYRELISVHPDQGHASAVDDEDGARA